MGLWPFSDSSPARRRKCAIALQVPKAHWVRAALVVAAVIAVFAPGPWQVGLGAEPPSLQSFDGGHGWINSTPVDPAQLRGKIVLVDFWEYTCLNCLRTMPYLREWYRRYHDDGFVIVGVHTPEFHFSGEHANVAAAVKRLNVDWPVVLDDSFAIWKRYGNTVWPHEYLYDRNGKLVESFEGEGGYQDTEARIQDASPRRSARAASFHRSWRCCRRTATTRRVRSVIRIRRSSWSGIRTSPTRPRRTIPRATRITRRAAADRATARSSFKDTGI